MALKPDKYLDGLVILARIIARIHFTGPRPNDSPEVINSRQPDKYRTEEEPLECRQTEINCDGYRR